MHFAGADDVSTVSLTIPARPEYLVFCRLVLAGLARTREIEPETLADMKLAVTEACSNSVRHAYDSEGGNVAVRFRLGVDDIAIDVEDEGRGFQPPALVTVPRAARETGMGLALIASLTEDLEVSPGAGGRGSRISFHKHLAGG
jgi:serine/threonine-protein kinase RsbW